jgi:cytoskeletal protein RodZ
MSEAGRSRSTAADDFVDTYDDVYARGHPRVIARLLDIDAQDLFAAHNEAACVRWPPAP